MKESDKFLPLYYHAKESVEHNTAYFLKTLGFELTKENIELAKNFSKQIMNIHNEIVKQHSWAFNELVKALEKSCLPPPLILTNPTKERGEKCE